MQAIGARGLVESEKSTRRRKHRELSALIAEKQAQVRRLVAEHESLLRIEAEQRNLLEKLGINEAAGV